MKTKHFCFFVLVLILSSMLISCGSQPAHVEAKTLHVPSYATYSGVMDAVKLDANLQSYTSYSVEPQSGKYDSVELGFIGTFVSDSILISLGNKTFSNWGQTCRTEYFGNFMAQDYQLTIPIVFTTTKDEAFLNFCQNQLPQTIKAVIVVASQGDGEILIQYHETDLDIQVKN